MSAVAVSAAGLATLSAPDAAAPARDGSAFAALLDNAADKVAASPTPVGTVADIAATPAVDPLSMPVAAPAPAVRADRPPEPVDTVSPDRVASDEADHADATPHDEEPARPARRRRGDEAESILQTSVSFMPAVAAVASSALSQPVAQTTNPSAPATMSLRQTAAAAPVTPAATVATPTIDPSGDAAQLSGVASPAPSSLLGVQAQPVRAASTTVAVPDRGAVLAEVAPALAALVAAARDPVAPPADAATADRLIARYSVPASDPAPAPRQGEGIVAPPVIAAAATIGDRPGPVMRAVSGAPANATVPAPNDAKRAAPLPAVTVETTTPVATVPLDRPETKAHAATITPLATASVREAPTPASDRLAAPPVNEVRAPAPAAPPRTAGGATEAVARETVAPLRTRRRDEPVAAVTGEQPTRTDPAAIAAPAAGATLAAGTTDRHVAVARHAAWADGIARDIASAAAPDGTARFAVAPEGLGSLNVEVRRVADAVDVRIVAASHDAAAAIADARPALVAEAHAHGIRVRDAQVEVARSDAAVVAPDQPVRADAVRGTDFLTPGGYGGGAGGDAGEHARRQAEAAQQPWVRTVRAVTSGRDDADRGRPADDGRYA